MTQELQAALKGIYGVRALRAILAGENFKVRGVFYSVNLVRGELWVTAVPGL
jgi:hypothetical protein